jgi:Peptidase family M1 domain
MNAKTAVGSFFLMCALGAIGQQQPQLQQRPQPAPVDAVNPPPPPAAMKAPEKLEPARAANANALYQSLRTRTVNGSAFTVKNLLLKRDAGEFTFSDGTFYLYGEVNGLITGAVFLGNGTLHIDPPSTMERRQLKLVMKSEVLNQPFTSAVFEFTDGTAAELEKGKVALATTSGAAVSQAQDAQTLFRRNLKHDLEARLLEDVIQPGKGAFFLADMKGPAFSKRLIYVVDPHGATGVEPEEVALLTSSDQGYDVALGFRSTERREHVSTKTNSTFRIPQQTIDVTIEKNGRMTGTVVSAVTAVEDETRVLPLMLAPTLRVSGVWGPGGEALDFVQEDKDRDADFAVVLQKPLKAGETIHITTAYAGKDVVLDMGSGNYYLVARESWYPNIRGSLGNYAHYYMTFRTAKNVQVVATGDRVKEREEGQQKISEWQTTTPIAVAGFNMGQFKSDQSERNKDVQIVTYANTSLADDYSRLPDAGNMALGTLSTTSMLKVATSEGDAAVQIYTDFFGPLPYDHVSLMQQTACNYGQSWPTLVYLPVCYFWDSTVQHQLGLLDHDPSYWKVVTAHEVAHQWWGQTVGFDSYRDQWMSEGFADFSASLFLLETRKDQKEYRDFWALMRRRLLEKNAQGIRPVDVGPVVMGSRVSTSRSGSDVYQMLIYPKGAYILHSLQMLFFTPKYGDQPFKAAMHDFVKSYRNKPATTEDFKAVMERDMPPWLDIQKNHKLDWFFDAYVYGTEVPRYSMTSTFEKKDDVTTVHFSLAQSGVSDSFTMLVPVYIEFADKRVVILGYVTIKGNHSIDQVVTLGKLTSEPKRMVANYNFDLLSD